MEYTDKGMMTMKGLPKEFRIRSIAGGVFVFCVAVILAGFKDQSNLSGIEAALVLGILTGGLSYWLSTEAWKKAVNQVGSSPRVTVEKPRYTRVGNSAYNGPDPDNYRETKLM